jgi:hypothetical protein
MHDAPSADELLEAVGRFLQEVAAPGLSGQAAFHAKVAANAIATVRRPCSPARRATLMR